MCVLENCSVLPLVCVVPPALAWSGRGSSASACLALMLCPQSGRPRPPWELGTAGCRAPWALCLRELFILTEAKVSSPLLFWDFERILHYSVSPDYVIICTHYLGGGSSEKDEGSLRSSLLSPSPPCPSKFQETPRVRATQRKKCFGSGCVLTPMLTCLRLLFQVLDATKRLGCEEMEVWPSESPPIL